MIELDLGADARRVVDEVKSNIDAITTFPIETESRSSASSRTGSRSSTSPSPATSTRSR